MNNSINFYIPLLVFAMTLKLQAHPHHPVAQADGKNGREFQSERYDRLQRFSPISL